MALIDRISRVVSGDIKRSNHLMAAEAWTWMRGENNRAVFVENMRLDASDDAQLDELRSHYLALNNNDKAFFMNDFTAWTIRLEDGTVTEAAFKTRFDIT